MSYLEDVLQAETVVGILHRYLPFDVVAVTVFESSSQTLRSTVPYFEARSLCKYPQKQLFNPLASKTHCAQDIWRIHETEHQHRVVVVSRSFELGKCHKGLTLREQLPENHHLSWKRHPSLCILC